MDPIPTYSKLLKDINGRQQEDLYTALMSKEKDTLDVVNKVVNHEASKQSFYKAFFNMPLSDIFNDYASCMAKFVGEVSIARNVDDVRKLVRDNKIVFYIGMTVVVFSTLVMLIESA
eukprot:gene19636-26321_t